MATPHVAGAAAAVLSRSPELSPAAVASRLLSGATPAVIAAAGAGTPNRLLFSDPSAGTLSAPTVSARTPAANATAIGVASSVTATFSRAVQGVSVATFFLKNQAGTVVTATVTYDATLRMATLRPSTVLAASQKYTATLTGGASAIRDTAGTPLVSESWAFTTAAAPTVTARTPGAGSTGVAVGSNITATFSTAVQGVTGSTFLVKSASGQVIPAAVTYSATTRTATLDPAVTLLSDTKYTATLIGGTAAIRDAAGTPLTGTSWTFTTGPAPVITSVTPRPGAALVRRANNIAVTFSEAVQGAGTGSIFMKNTATGTTVAATVSRYGTTNQWILNPSATLAAKTSYRVTVTGGPAAIRDLAGNSLATYSWTFTTGSY
jgi:hypothetical protein